MKNAFLKCSHFCIFNSTKNFQYASLMSLYSRELCSMNFLWILRFFYNTLCQRQLPIIVSFWFSSRPFPNLLYDSILLTFMSNWCKEYNTSLFMSILRLLIFRVIFYALVIISLCLSMFVSLPQVWNSQHRSVEEATLLLRNLGLEQSKHGNKKRNWHWPKPRGLYKGKKIKKLAVREKKCRLSNFQMLLPFE